MSWKAERAAKAWRRLLIANACLCFSLPIAGMIFTGRAAAHSDAMGHHLQAGATAAAGGVATVALAIFGFFLGAIFLVVGLLVGRSTSRHPTVQG